ncbi:MAG TPA: TIGR02996 domain-containing protein [Gemmata sp.]
MSDEAALLAAIRAHPDDDTPRLIYADWLDENGQPDRAEFIRLQCLPGADETQLMREAELEERNRGRWLVGLGVPQFAEANWEFRRGFPERLATDIDWALGHYDTLARAPWLRFLSLREADNSSVRDFLARAWPPQWVELGLLENWDVYARVDYDATPSIVAIASCPQVKRLRRLRLSGYTLVEEAQRALAPLRAALGDRLVID